MTLRPNKSVSFIGNQRQTFKSGAPPPYGYCYLDGALQKDAREYPVLQIIDNPEVDGFVFVAQGSASCGSKFSLSSIGHTGFTGTSLWYDPKQDLLVTIRSNRVSPTRENKAFVGLRPQIHSEIARLLI